MPKSTFHVKATCVGVDEGYRRLAAAIVHNAYEEYWDNYCIYRIAQEEENKFAQKEAKYQLERVERFFNGEWYQEVLCGLAPNLTTLRFSWFKSKVEEMYMLMRMGKKKSIPVDKIFYIARNPEKLDEFINNKRKDI